MPLINCLRQASIYRGRKYWKNWSCSVTACAMRLAILEFDPSLTSPTRNRLRMPLSGQTISRFKVIACAQIRPDRLIVDIRCSESKPFVRHSRALSRRIDRVVRIFRTDQQCSRLRQAWNGRSCLLSLKDHGAGHNRAATCPMQGDPASRCDRVADPVT